MVKVPTAGIIFDGAAIDIVLDKNILLEVDVGAVHFNGLAPILITSKAIVVAPCSEIEFDEFVPTILIEQFDRFCLVEINLDFHMIEVELDFNLIEISIDFKLEEVLLCKR